MGMMNVEELGKEVDWRRKIGMRKWKGYDDFMGSEKMGGMVG